MRISVGSRNAPKVEAVREAFEEIFGPKVDIIQAEVSSGVPQQPVNEEVVLGATNRALGARREDADFSVGIEGGMMELQGTNYFTGICVVIDKEGNKSTGTSGWFECPPAVLQEIRRGKELGGITDSIYSRVDTKSQEGTVGIWTRGAITRKDLYKHGIKLALIRYLNKELW